MWPHPIRSIRAVTLSVGLTAMLALAALPDVARAQDTATDTATTAATTAAETLDSAQRLQIEGVIRDYLLENPAVLVEALEAYRRQQEEAEAERARAAVADLAPQLERSATSPFIGPADAAVTVVEFFDYNCPYCKRMVEPTMAIVDRFDDVKVVFKELPILSADSELAARAALAAAEQDAYDTFHTALMQIRGRVTEDSIFRAAAEVGLDVPALRDAMDAPWIREEIVANLRLAESIGVRGTPAYVINGEVLPGALPPDQLFGVIEQARTGD